MKLLTNISILFLMSACANNAIHNDRASCVDHPSQYSSMASELQKIEREDQEDRQGDPSAINWTVVSPRDLKRRIRVSEIFAQGCFKDSPDYAAAAMVYQHGDTADHAYQTFLWANKAVDLGDSKQKWLMSAGLDRYLVRIGRKQLFATQAAKDSESPCWCLEPTELTFPEVKRIEYSHRSLQQSFDWVKSMNANSSACTEAMYCHHNLKSSPAGTVPGFW